MFLPLFLIVATWVQAGTMPAVGKVHFKTKDGWTLAALYQAPQKGKPVAVLVHGVGSVKEEWDKLATELGKLGFGTLALDLRSHGESLKGPNGQKTDWQSLGAAGGWARLEEDIEAAIKYLGRKKIPPSRIGLAGASIGANLVSQVAGRHPDLAWVILLSPGRDYRSVRVNFPLTPPTLSAASPPDAYAFSTYLDMVRAAPGIKFLQARNGHGVQMFEDKEFFSKLIAWIQKN